MCFRITLVIRRFADKIYLTCMVTFLIVSKRINKALLHGDALFNIQKQCSNNIRPIAFDHLSIHVNTLFILMTHHHIG